MIAPNKVVSLERSALGKSVIILEQGPAPVQVGDLYRAVRKHFDGIDEFLLAVDVLYILGRVELDYSTRTLVYAY